MAIEDQQIPAGETQVKVLPTVLTLNAFQEQPAGKGGPTLGSNLSTAANPNTTAQAAQETRTVDASQPAATGGISSTSWNFGDVLKNVMSSLIEAAKETFNFFKDMTTAVFGASGPFKQYGGAVLIGLAVTGITFLALHFANSGDSSSSISASTPAIGASQKQAAAMVAHMHEQLNSVSQDLIDNGADPEETHTTQNAIELTNGSPLVLSSIKDPATKSRALFVTGKNAPGSYVTLSQLNTGRYFQSLNQTTTPSTILDNSSALHGAERQDH